MSRCFLIFGVTFFYISFAFSEIVRINDKYELTEERTKELNNYSEKYNKSLSVEFSPCENFHDFVCKTKQWPDFSYIQKNYYNLLMKYFKHSKELSIPEQKLKAYLDSIEHYFNSSREEVMDIVKEFVDEFIKENSDLLRTWPAVGDTWKSENFDLESTLGLIQRLPKFYGFDIKFKRSPVSDAQSLSFTNYNFKNYKINTTNIEVPNEVITDALQFQKEYDEFYENYTQHHGGLPELHTFDFRSFKGLYPNFNWNKVVKGMTRSEIKLHDNFEIVISGFTNFQIFMDFITSVNSKIAANYLFVRFQENLFHFKDSFLEDEYIENSDFGPVLCKLLGKLFYGEENHKALEQLINLTFKNLNDVSKSINLTTAEEFYNQNLKNISFPDFNDETFVKKYEDMNINSRNFLKNYFYFRTKYFRLNYNPQGFNEENWRYFLKEIENLIGNPLVVLFQSLAKFFFMEYENILKVDSYKMFSNALKKCKGSYDFKQSAYGIFDLIIKCQLFMKTFTDWTKENIEIIKAENDIFNNYGLSSEKLFFIEMVRSSYVCVHPTEIKSANIYLSIKGLKQFSDAFNCPEGLVMNPKEKCYYEDIL